jgi:DNA invertase Pin-like site-specific DNA recombinase
MKAVIYTRVSTAEQADTGTSLATQEQACRTWCKANGYDTGPLFSDAGESAKTADRPQFIALLAWCKEHRPDAVVVWKFDRWARNSTDHAVACAALGKYGTRLISATEAATDDPAGRLLQTILSGIAQFDNEVRAERVKTAMRETARRGGWFTYAPYGFKSGRSDSTPILVEDPERGPIVREMFTGLADGRRTLAQTITYAGEFKINKNSARQMLRAPVYGGIIRSTLTDNQEIQAAFPGIVSADTWRQAQMIMAGRSVAPRRPRPEWPLRCLLRCPQCGLFVTACSSKGHGGTYEYYQCSRGHVRARVADVHASFDDVLRGFSQEYTPILERLKSWVKVMFMERSKCAKAVEKTATADAERCRAKRARLLEGYLSGAIAFDVYRQTDLELEGKVKASVELSKQKVDWAVTTENVLSRCAQLLEDPVAVWSRLDLDRRRRFISALFDGDLYLAPSGDVQNSKKAGIIGELDKISAANGDVAYLAGLCQNLCSLIKRFDMAA